MYGKRVYRRRPRKYLRKRKIGIKRRSAVSGRVRRYVKSAIHKMIENKEFIAYGANQSVVVNTPSTQQLPLLIPINNGNNEYSRIGNQIKLVKGQLRLTVNLMPYESTTNPLYPPVWVKIWVVRDLKNTGQMTTIDATAFSRFFRVNGGGVGMQNTTLDTLLDVNKDYFRVLTTRMFKLGGSYKSSGSMNSSSWFDNSPFCKKLTIDYTKYAKKQLKFDDSAGNSNLYPINSNIYFVIQAVNAQGDSATSGMSLIEYHYTNIFNYEDA